jgi:hypothetical protein
MGNDPHRRIRVVAKGCAYSGALAVVLTLLVSGEFHHAEGAAYLRTILLFFLCVLFAPVYGIVRFSLEDPTQWYAMGYGGLSWCIASIVAAALVPMLPDGAGKNFAIACACVLWGWSQLAVAGSAV